MKHFRLLTVLVAFFTLCVTNSYAANYDLWVLDTQVTTDNMGNIVPNVNPGWISYAPLKKTLTLYNVTLDNATSTLIRSEIEGLTIEIIGDNSILYDKNVAYAITLEGSTTITGGGKLEMKKETPKTRHQAINCDDGKLTIDDVTLLVSSINGCASGGIEIKNSKVRVFDGYITCSTIPIVGSTKYGNVTINNSRVEALFIQSVGSLTLENCTIAEPLGSYFNANTREVVKVREHQDKNIIIAPTYPLYINGKQVNEVNKDTILGQNDGGVKYNPETKKLNLMCGITATGNNYAIISGVPGLTIDCKPTDGNTFISSQNGAALYLQVAATIKSTNEVYIQSANSSAISLSNAALTVDAPKLVATGKDYGIVGSNSGVGYLVLENNTKIEATGTNYGSVCVSSISAADGYVITEPEGAVFNSTAKAVTKNGNVVKTKVVIETDVKYPIWVKGIQVTKSNQNDVLGDGGKKVTYDPTTNTLTLNNATIAAGNNTNAIKSNQQGLHLNLIGNNTISSTNWAALQVHQSTIIDDSTGTLTATSTQYVGFYIDNCNVTVLANLVVQGATYGIKGADNAALTVGCTTLKATGTNSGSIVGVELTLVNSRITKPTDAEYSTRDGGSITTPTNQIIKTEVVIEPGSDYDLWILGTRITSDNKNNITGTGITGWVSYDSNRNILRLSNATIKSNNTTCIESKIPGLTIEYSGNNTIEVETGDYRTPLSVTGDVTIEGDGGSELDIKVPSTSFIQAITATNCALTIKYGTVNITGGAFMSVIGSSSSLAFESTNVTINGGGYPIAGFNSVTFTNCEITKPLGATISNPIKTYVVQTSDGQDLKGELKITRCTYYDLWVGGKQVSTLNYGDVLGDGTVSYSTINKTLTLNNANISVAEGEALKNEIVSLNIDLVGDNKLEVTNDGSKSAMQINKPTTIKGSGTLLAKHSQKDAITAQSATLIIDNTTVTAEGLMSGITMDGTMGDLIVQNNANLTASSLLYGLMGHKNNDLVVNNSHIISNGCIYGFDNLVLIGCEISEPVNAYYGILNNLKAVLSRNEIVMDRVVISVPNQTGVENSIISNVTLFVRNKQLTVENTNNLPIAIFNLMGQVVANKQTTSNVETFDLPTSGIYIVRVGNNAEKISVK